MQPRGPLPDENEFVALQRDSLPPPRVTTAMNIGRGRATGTRSRKKAKVTKRGRGGRRGGRRGHGNDDNMEVPNQRKAMQEVSTSCSLEMEDNLMLHLKK
jgi:hypothetical protein